VLIGVTAVFTGAAKIIQKRNLTKGL